MAVQPIDDGDVLVAVEDRIVTVTLNRPTKRNALTQDMYARLADTLLAAEDDRSIAAVVITGAGVAFTAGNDLADFSSGGNLEQTTRFLGAIASVHVPIVAAVNGMAIGVGLTMLLHFDLVFVEPEAKLSVPFAALGLVPEAASSLLLPRFVGPRNASDLLLAGKTIDGTTAAHWGLANASVSPALDAAVEAAHQLAAQPPEALRLTKALLRCEEPTVAGRMAMEMDQFGRALLGAEFAEVMAARSEGRPPVFAN